MGYFSEEWEQDLDRATCERKIQFGRKALKNVIQMFCF